MFTRAFVGSIIFFCLSNAYSSIGSTSRLAKSSVLLSQFPKGGSLSSYSFATTSGENINVNVQYYEYKDGYMAMSGGEYEASEPYYFLKGVEGEQTDLFGWVMLYNENRAYKYSTDSEGYVIVEQVPLTDIVPICNLEGVPFAPGSIPLREHSDYSGPEAHIGEYDGQDLYTLESLKGAKKIIWLDIQNVMNGGTPKYMSKEEMYKTWQVVASSFSMFDVNVTTNKALWDEADSRDVAAGLFRDQEGRSNCCIGCVGSRGKCNIDLQTNGSRTHYQYGKTAVHELGHMMGLQHDGSSAGEYYGGHRNYEWNTIMGNNLCCGSWDEALIQWNDGSYSGSNNPQKDLEIINRWAPFRIDDIPNSVPIKFSGAGGIDSLENRGQINKNTDEDRFTFQIVSVGGHVNVEIYRTELRGGSALDIEADIVNASTGAVIATDNPIQERSSKFNIDLPIGSYYFAIRGGAEGEPSVGFPNYASLGFYAISGTITGSGSINNSLTLSGPNNICAGTNLTLSAHVDAGYTYSWFKDDQLLPGATGSELVVTQKGQYYVKISNGGGEVNSKVIDVNVLDTPNAPSVSMRCGDPGQVHLDVTGSGGAIHWYASATSTDILYTGAPFTVNLQQGASYFVSESSSALGGAVGLKNNIVATGGYHAGDYYLIFNAEKDLRIQSVLVYAQGAKERRFLLMDSRDNEIAAKNILVPAGESRVPLDFDVPMGNDYKIGVGKINDEDANLYRSNTGVNYPYEITGLVSINNSTAGGDPQNYYYYLYDWEVEETGLCSSPRTEVNVSNCTPIQSRGPGSISIVSMANSILIQAPQGGVKNITIISTDGALVYSLVGSTDYIDISNYTSGIYILRIKSSQGIIERKIAKQ